MMLPQPRRVESGLGWTTGTDPAVTVDPSMHRQGYRLTITPSAVEIVGGSAAGVFYGRQTLAQMPTPWACGVVEDWPDFEVRGVMLDVSRDKVPTPQTLFGLVDKLASWKVNQLQLYTEHTFAYSQHGLVWKDASPLTGEEIRALDQYCRARFIELVPNQNSFGHMERWLKHKPYEHLAEAVDGAQTPWGFRWDGPFSLCPTDPAVIEFLAGLYDELLPNFLSRWFNVGCDETFDVGQGRSKAVADRVGVHRVYLEFLHKVHRLATARGRRMMFWGDVILHQPELIKELPEDVIALQWGYEADHPFDAEGEKFAAAGVPFYVCPGTSTWNSLAGRTDNAVANLIAAAESGRRHGAAGYLITDWGDNGHHQYLSASYLGFMVGAAVSWCLSANRSNDWVGCLDRFAFGQPLGRAAYDLGNVYQSAAKHNANGSILFRLMVPSPMDKTPEAGLTAKNLDDADNAIDAIRIDGSGVDAEELRQSAQMLRHAVDCGRRRLCLTPRGQDVDRLIAEHERLWLTRNRPGGLVDSVKRIADSR